MFSEIWNKLKEIISKMLGMQQTIESTLHMMPCISSRMSEAIQRWTDMYEDKAPWIQKATASNPVKVASLGLPAFIASEKARMVMLELKSEITAPSSTEEVDNPDYFPPISDQMGNIRSSGQPKKVVKETVEGPEERARYLNTQYQDKLLPKMRTQLEYGIAKGSLIIKPYIIKSKKKEIAGMDLGNSVDTYEMSFDFVQADCFYPFSFDSSGNITEVAFIETKSDKDKVYTRLEYHKIQSGVVTVINKAYESTTNNMDGLNVTSGISLGKEIPLTQVSEWKDIPPQATINNVDRLLFGYFRMPDANTVDPHSPLGISGFARAESLIKEADLQYSRLLWEFEGGELAIDIDRDALTDTTDSKGNSHTIMGKLQQRLYRPIDLGQSDTYKPYNPSLRDHSLINGLNNILMRIEDVCALSRGTISDVATEARTATELKILKQRSYSSNAEIQKMVELALKDVVYTMNVYCTLYNIVGDIVMLPNGNVDSSKMGLYDVSFTWDDSILVDVDTELSKRLTLLEKGLTSKREVRMWYFGESARQAQTALNSIRDENMEAIEQNMIVSSQLGRSISNNNLNNGTEDNTRAEEQNSIDKGTMGISTEN